MGRGRLCPGVVLTQNVTESEAGEENAGMAELQGFPGN